MARSCANLNSFLDEFQDHLVAVEFECGRLMKKAVGVLTCITPSFIRLERPGTGDADFVEVTIFFGKECPIKECAAEIIIKKCKICAVELCPEFGTCPPTLFPTITPTIGPCGCQVTNQAGRNFDISRGTGAADTTVIFNGGTLPANAHGSVDYTGHFCLACASNNTFTFNYGGTGTVPAFIFTATTFSVPHCPNNIVTVTGVGTDNIGLFGTSASYTLVINGVMNNKSISITLIGQNGNTFVASTTTVGNGEVSVTNCP